MVQVPTKPIYPASGLPSGTKEAGMRVDFKADNFALLIETKGYLLAWSRASICPCRPVSAQTEQPHPNCPLCKGAGWFYFGADSAPDYELIGNMDEVQKRIIEDQSALVVRGLITGIQTEYSPWDSMGNWMAGTMQLTTRHENKLGYYDRIVILETEIVYSEVVTATGNNPLAGRYLITGMDSLRSIDRVYKPDVDFVLERGEIKFFPSAIPARGTRLTMHYLCHPTVLVIEHPHIIRQSPVQKKTANPKTPRGDSRGLPVQALVRYDFIPGPT